MKEHYYTIDGQMHGYKSGGVQKDFLSDSLGSVTAEVDQTQTKTYDGRYKPYGGTLSSTGSPGSYLWVGIGGYRSTELAASCHYVRARHYSKTSGSWTTIDRFWPHESTYGYADGACTSSIDETGNGPYKCERCALAIWELWKNSDTHFCCHEFSHCMACCILNHEFDLDCAVWAQNEENMRLHHTKEQSDGLMKICKDGADGTETARCGAHCAHLYGKCNGKEIDPRCPYSKKPLSVWDMKGDPVHPGLPPICYNASPICKGLSGSNLFLWTLF